MADGHDNDHTTHVVRQRFSVPFEYPVVFTWDALEPANTALLDVFRSREPGKKHRVVVVLDAGLEAAWPDLREKIGGYFARHAAHLEQAGEPISLPGGESTKNSAEATNRLHALFAQHHIDRHSFVLAVGGGSLLDTAGYAAATAHRGVRIVRMPTTVLAQNDSGAGVKNGINAFGSKNYLGCFAPPFGVVNDFRFLERLPARDRLAGLAEAIKVSLIRDAEFFAWLEAHANELAASAPGPQSQMIRRCAELHLRHIASGGDPFEKGSSRPLDFGHWAAHKIEILTAHELRHGEAVALGLLLDSRYSFEAGLLGAADFARIDTLVRRLGLPRWHDVLRMPGAASGSLAVLAGLHDFREHLGGELTVTLLRGIGQPVDVHTMDEARIRSAIDWMGAHRHGQP